MWYDDMREREEKFKKERKKSRVNYYKVTYIDKLLLMWNLTIKILFQTMISLYYLFKD